VSLFITFEGPDGSGKSTQLRLLAVALEQAGAQVLVTREPGGTRIGNAIRNLLHDRDHVEMSPQAEALLYNAARAQLVAEIIRPALAAGTIVLCDRFADSTLAYQGFGYGRDLEQLRQVIRFATDGLQPHLTLLLRVDPAAGLQRKLGDDQEWNRMEDKALAFHNAVYHGYLQLAAAEPTRWAQIDATSSIDQVQAAIWAVVQARLAEQK